MAFLLPHGPASWAGTSYDESHRVARVVRWLFLACIKQRSGVTSRSSHVLSSLAVQLRAR
jgi:hypothetical protein